MDSKSTNDIGPDDSCLVDNVNELTAHSSNYTYTTSQSADNVAKCACRDGKNLSSSNAIFTACSAPDCVYNYLNSQQPTYEQFKVQIGNVNKHITVKLMKKFLQAQGFDTSKIKPVGRGLFFATFRSAEDREKAVETLNGFTFRGRSLEVKVSMPAKDPLIVKRSQAKLEEEEGRVSPLAKRQKLEESEINDPNASVAPLYQMTYNPDQLKAKQKHALECLKKVRRAVSKVNKSEYCDSCFNSGFLSSAGKSMDPELCPITPSPLLNGYRNKAKFTIGKDNNGKGPVVGVRLGKYRDNSTAVAYPAAAPIFSATTHATMASLQAFLDTIYHQPHEVESAAIYDRVAARVSVFDMITRSGNWCTVTVRESRMSDRLLEIEIRRGDLTDEDLADLKFALKQWFEPGAPGASVGVTSLYLIVLTSVSQLSGAFTEHCIFGKQTITELCCGLKFAISRDAFFQVNTYATELLYEELRRRCETILEQKGKSTHDAILLDICCGTGPIGLSLANCFEKVIGIELIPSAVENAKMNAELNGITNAVFYAGRAEVVLKHVMQSLPEDKEIVAVLDPPRAGVNLGVVEAIRRCKQIRHLLYVACDLSRAVANFEAFARPPSKKYVGSSFVPTVASCIDLFPHTPGIEVVLSLERVPSSNCVHRNETPAEKTAS